MRAYRSVEKEAETELIIQRSRFIGRCFPVEEEAEALEILGGIRKQNWDASHNCFAYRIGENAATARFSDDGEPGGTAGKPIMDVLMNRSLTNALVVVTRYFGGILLGAGGLVRAYSKSAADACTAAGSVEMCPGIRLNIRVDYARYDALEKLLSKQALIEDKQFAEDVLLQVLVSGECADSLCAAIIDKTDGQCVPQRAGEAYMRVLL